MDKGDLKGAATPEQLRERLAGVHELCGTFAVMWEWLANQGLLRRPDSLEFGRCFLAWVTLDESPRCLVTWIRWKNQTPDCSPEYRGPD